MAANVVEELIGQINGAGEPGTAQKVWDACMARLAEPGTDCVYLKWESYHDEESDGHVTITIERSTTLAETQKLCAALHTLGLYNLVSVSS